MKGFKLPATIKWAIANCLPVWITMSLYRGFLLGVFLGGGYSKVLAMLSGMLIDAGVVSFILVLYILISLVPSLHPFKSRSGKVFGFVYFFFWGMLVALSYALDLVFVKTIHYRLFGSKVFDILGNSNEIEVFLRNFTFGPLLVAIVLVVWVYGYMVARLHRYISRMSRLQNKTMRITSQGWVIITGSLLAIFVITENSTLQSSELNIKEVPAEALKSNPLLSFFTV